MSDFVHLHVHTQYSLLDGAIPLEGLLQRALDYDMKAVAMTDHGAMYGAVAFYQQALKAKIKPIIGCECYLAPRTIRDKTTLDNKGLAHLVLLAENQEGYRNLCRLVTIAHQEGFYYKPRIDKDLLRRHASGLIALSACLHGEIPQLLKDGKLAQAEEAARWYRNTFGENNFFLEVQHNGIEIQNRINQDLMHLGERLSIPLVATNDCHYLDRDDVEAHEVLLCIQTKKTIKDQDRFRFQTDELFFKSEKDMTETLGAFPGAIQNTQKIAERCQVELVSKGYHFPKFKTDSEVSADEQFDLQVRDGFEKRLDAIRSRQPDVDESLYRKRLEYEMDVIKKMGFADYFLIVADFIRFGRENQVPVGPGRGSAAGSMVAYSMGITDLDPIAHGLLFERFLNPERISMPDIDVDFCINGREKVLNYIFDRYGGDYVAQIATFGKLKPRAVIRDVGRALDIPLKEVDAIAKLVPTDLKITIDKALEQEPRLRDMVDNQPEVARLIRICRVLEGLTRHPSTHAAGVVIGDKPLVEYLPLHLGNNGEVVTQFEMKCVEEIGLVKFDLLGLRNLTVIQTTLNLIATQGKAPPGMTTLDMNDPATYRLLCSGDTTGVFQLESSGMKELLTSLRPERFEDITALVALYRPGPLESGMVKDYVERKHGRARVEYPLPELEPVLRETYGVILYQEQVMKIAAVLADYSMADADGLRKAMGKKDQALMARHRDRFLQGATDSGIDPKKARQIFDLIEKFGGYGFNKSHSAAYALIAYQTAYLKANYPVEFTAALLTSDMGNSDEVVKHISECRKHSIAVLPPDINESQKEFTVVDEKIRFGMNAVRNVGEAAIDVILKERNTHGPFSSLFEFCERVDLRKVNKRVIESLIKCGAFDSTGAGRSRMMAALDDAVDYGQTLQKEKSDPQMGLFDTLPGQSALNPPSLPQLDEWNERELLNMEKETLGFYISGHPLEQYHEVLTKYTNADTITISEMRNGNIVRMGGIVKNVKTIRTKNGDNMAFITLEDMHGGVEAIVFSSLYESIRDFLAGEEPVLIEGELQKDENSVKIKAGALIPIDKAEEVWTASIHITIDVKRSGPEVLREVKNILGRFPGNISAFLHIVDPGVSDTLITVGNNLKVRADSMFIQEINGLLGYRAVETRCNTERMASVG